MAKSPTINNPAIIIPVDRRNGPWPNELPAQEYPSRFRPGINLLSFWFIAPNDTEHSKPRTFFMALLPINSGFTPLPD
jgi:hypothetical protein